MTHRSDAATTRENVPASEVDELIDQLDSTVMVLGRLFSARHGETCGEGGMSTAHMLALRVIHESGPSRIGDLAAHMGIKRPAASALVDALESHGHIARLADGEDRRVTMVALTDTGIAQLKHAEMERREHMRRYFSVLSNDDVQALIRIHRTLIDAMMTNRV